MGADRGHPKVFQVANRCSARDWSGSMGGIQSMEDLPRDGEERMVMRPDCEDGACSTGVDPWDTQAQIRRGSHRTRSLSLSLGDRGQATCVKPAACWAPRAQRMCACASKKHSGGSSGQETKRGKPQPDPDGFRAAVFLHVIKMYFPSTPLFHVLFGICFKTR